MIKQVQLEILGPVKRSRYETAATLKVAQLIEPVVRDQALPLARSTGEPIVYRLYRRRANAPEVIDAQTVVSEIFADLLLIGDEAAHWWQEPGRHLPPLLAVPQAAEPPVSQATPAPCRLILAPGVVLSVPFQGLMLSRTLIEAHLPPLTRTLIAVQRFLGVNGPITRVSRLAHCRIYREGNLWVVQAHAPTWWQGQALAHTARTVISRSGLLELGQPGWPVQVEVDRPA